MRSRILSFLLISFLMLVAINPSLLAASPKKVLIFDFPRFYLTELSGKYPNLLKLVNQGTSGIMTFPFQEPLTIDQVYLGFNSGRQLKTTEESNLLFNIAEEYKGIPAGKLYQTFTGWQAPSQGVVQLGLTKLIQSNTADVNSKIGLFGRLLHQHSLKTGVIGNADADLINRSGALMIMDDKGQVDWGAIGAETTVTDPRFPHGLRTDRNQLFSRWKDFDHKAQIIVISLGDLERLERYSLYLSAPQWRFYRQQVLADYDQLIGHFLKEVDINSTLIVVFTALPSARNDALATRLAPVIIKGPGFSSGLLFSGSTRKPGLITGNDLPVTVLNFLGIKSPGYLNGQVLKGVSGNWRFINQEQLQFSRNYSIRGLLLTTYAYLFSSLVLLGLISISFWPSQTRLLKILGFSYLFLITIPAVFLIEAFINPLDWVAIIGWTIGLGILLSLIAIYFSKRDQLVSVGMISLFTVGLIIYEGIFNGFLELHSFLGYSAVAGTRFYGIGNEYVGVLLGAYVVAISLGIPRFKWFKNVIFWFMVGFLTFILIHPNFGANTRGGITVLIGLSITTFLWMLQPMALMKIPFMDKHLPEEFKGFAKKYSGPVQGILGLTLTTIVVLFINNSGIVTVATMYSFGMTMLLLVLFKELSYSKELVTS